MKSSVRAVIGIAATAGSIAFALSCGSSTAPAAKMYSATLTGAKQIPAVTTSATGTATFTDNVTSIDYTVSVTNITGVTMSHIHLGNATTNGAVIINLFIPSAATGAVNGTLATGSITSATNTAVSLDSLRTLFNNGNAYVNVHTTVNGGGEIRGQVAASN